MVLIGGKQIFIGQIMFLIETESAPNIIINDTIKFFS